MEFSSDMSPRIPRDHGSESLLQELGDQKFALDQAAIVAATDQFGTITYVNSKFCEVSGYSEQELIGSNHRLLSSGIHPTHFFEDLWQTISSGRVWRGEICNRKKDGSLYWVSTCIVPFLDRSRKPYQYLSIRHEITALKEAQQKIFEQQLQLASSARLSALGEVSAGISHEINNPLGVILGRVEMMQNHLQSGLCDHKFLIKSLEQIDQTAHRISSIVQSMRIFASGGELHLDEVIQPKELIDLVHNLLKERFQKASVELVVEGISTDETYSGSMTLLLQIAVNLLGNAFDAVTSWAPDVLPKPSTKHVTIQFLRDSSHWGFSVLDNGPGIPSHVSERLFEPFFTTKSAHSGTGLGLSLSRAMARKMGGDLFWDKNSSQTCFRVRFPIKPSTA